MVSGCIKILKMYRDKRAFVIRIITTVFVSALSSPCKIQELGLTATFESKKT
jgi:hypothetical protein